MKEPLAGIMAEFDDHEELLRAARAAHAAGYRKMDAYSPFPVQGLATALGHLRCAIPLLVLAGGITGGLGGYFMEWFAMVKDYPIDVGGRPLHSWPAFIPIAFELTVLCAALTAIISMLAFNRLPQPYHPVFQCAGIRARLHRSLFPLHRVARSVVRSSRHRKLSENTSSLFHYGGPGVKTGAIILALAVLCAGCRREMYYQPRGDPLKSSDFFADGAASRPLPAHTVAQENFHVDLSYDSGKIGTNYLAQIPFPVTRKILERGREQFDIYCAVCHGRTGQGNGIVPQRGFPAPPSYDIERLRAAPPGYFYNVITHGYGVMFSYANRVNTDDRWAIAAYIRALQLSRNATMTDVPPAERAKLEAQSQ